MRILTFLIICYIHTTFGHNVQPRHCSRMCFYPLEIYVMLFWSFLTLYNPYQPFSMFSCYFQCLLAYIWLITTSMDYLCIPHTIVYIFDVFPTLSDLLLTLFIFALIDIPMFWLFIVLVGCAIPIGLDSDPYVLLVISDPSDTISTSLRSCLLMFYLSLPF